MASTATTTAPSSSSATTTTTPQPIRIALVISTIRQPRACPQIATFVHDTITTLDPPVSTPTPTPTSTTTNTSSSSSSSPSTSTPSYTLTLLDLLSHPLPFHDEPLIPSQITNPSQYTHAHTQAWSATVSAYDAFIFVTPQYNWGYPPVLKNAIDYLYHEWSGKPALVVSYGGHGGGKCNAQLREVLNGVRMDVVGHGVELAFGGREVVKVASQGKELGLDGARDGEEGLWADRRVEIVEGFRALLGRCEGGKGGEADQ